MLIINKMQETDDYCVVQGVDLKHEKYYVVDREKFDAYKTGLFNAPIYDNLQDAVEHMKEMQRIDNALED